MGTGAVRRIVITALLLVLWSGAPASAATFDLSGFDDGPVVTLSAGGLALTFSDARRLDGTPDAFRQRDGGMFFNDDLTPSSAVLTFSNDVRLLSYTVSDLDGINPFFDLVQGNTVSAGNRVRWRGTYAFSNATDVFRGGVPISLLSGDVVAGAAEAGFQGWALSAITVAPVPVSLPASGGLLFFALVGLVSMRRSGRVAQGAADV